MTGRSYAWHVLAADSSLKEVQVCFYHSDVRARLVYFVSVIVTLTDCKYITGR